MDLKCSRSIEVFWEQVRKIKEIFEYPSSYDFYFFLGRKKKLLQKIGPGSSAIDAGGSWTLNNNFLQKLWFQQPL
jgi:hypothetical protein